MKIYTQAEFDAINRDEYGIKHCPTGDYSHIKDFGAWCSFGEGCRFENVGEYVGRYPYVAFIGCGSRVGSETYVYNLDRGIYVRCGCFLGTLAEFRERVRTENADPLYLDFVDLAERRLNEWRAES